MVHWKTLSCMQMLKQSNLNWKKGFIQQFMIISINHSQYALNSKIKQYHSRLHRSFRIRLWNHFNNYYQIKCRESQINLLMNQFEWRKLHWKIYHHQVLQSRTTKQRTLHLNHIIIVMEDPFIITTWVVWNQIHIMKHKEHIYTEPLW